MLGCGVLLLCASAPVDAADFAQAEAAFFQGDYDTCIELTRAEVEKGIWNDFWSRKLIQALLATGRYQDAREVYEQVQTKFSSSISLRILGAEAYRYCGEHEKGDALLDEIPALVQSAPWRYSDRENLLALGKYLLGQGEDARNVLEAFFDRPLKSDSKYVAAHLAVAELALDKADFQEAAKSLQLAVELEPEDPYIRYLLARAWAPSDSRRAAESLMTALELNPQHAESLLLHARNLIDSESYDEAQGVLDEVLAVNASHPLAWALKAAIAHLQGDYREEGEYRKKGLETWSVNPAVDYWIGKTLSQHYRFVEGVKYQRRSLRLDPNYLPAKFQLAQDLLRVGADDEGWSIVDQVSQADKYNVVAFNLKTLHDRISKFTTIEVPGFIIRMDAREAKIYGPRVAELLLEAKETLSAKYAVELDRPVTVEIFPQQSDFAIRTFGLPGGAGFLGVCFGSLITANSPASQGESPSNWESVLWHEFCHVITLQKTKNRMPRWLSEGISVYEELQRDPSWGQRMNPLYKGMILGEDLVPLSELSGAFLNPKSPLHLQFAYFESSLAVRYLIDRHGLPLMLKLLEDLGVGVPMQEAFARRLGDTELLDKDFEEYITGAAEAFASDVDFGREGLPEPASEAQLKEWLAENPQSYVAQRQLVRQLAGARKWDEAWEAAGRLRELFPDDAEPGGTLDLSAQIARQMGKIEAEKEILQKICGLAGDRAAALTRLIELSREDENWPDLAAYSAKLLAVQPLIPIGHEGLVESARQLGQPQKTLNSLRALQEMDPLDPAGLHYELAEMLVQSDKMVEARLEVLMALEQSPRYREAQKLLVRIHRSLHAEVEDEAAGSDIRIAAPDVGQPPRPETEEPIGL